MDVVSMVLMFGCLAAVVFWYIENDRKDRDGSDGFLSIFSETEAPELDTDGLRSARYKARRAPEKAARNFDTDAAKKVRHKVKKTTDKEKTRHAYHEKKREAYVAKKVGDDRVLRFKSRKSPDAKRP